MSGFDSLPIEGIGSPQQPGVVADGTPSSRWAASGEPDPHGVSYYCERAALAHGDMTDDELANAVFLCDHRRSLDSIGLVMAAKDRIRWLSRKLAALAPAATAVDGVDLQALATAVVAAHATGSETIFIAHVNKLIAGVRTLATPLPGDVA